MTCVQNKAIDPIAHKLAQTGISFLVFTREEVAGSFGTISKLCPFSRRHTVWAIAAREPLIVDLGSQYAVSILEHVAAQGRMEALQKEAFAAVHFDAAAHEEGGEEDAGLMRWMLLQKRLCLHVAEQHRLTTHDDYHAALAKAVREITARTSVFLSTVDCAHTVHFHLLQQSGRTLDAIILDEVCGASI